jgi:hypothetical protein
MRTVRLDRLFHSLVVLGAAIGAGCGGHVETSSGTTEGGTAAGGGGGSAAAGGQGGGAATTTGDGGFIGTSTGTAGTGTVIDDPSDCEHPSQFECYLCPDCGCECNPDLPAAPEDCGSTTDFHCDMYTPEYVTCHCYPEAPDKPEDCPDQEYFYCAIEDPPIGCYCVVPIA